MFSVMENTETSLRFHILCDRTLTDEARNDLAGLCESRGHRICFYDIPEDDRISKVRLFRSGYTEGILYRLHMPELLPDVSRIIYLDADILANGDILDLWETGTGDAIIAGLWDPPLFGYKPVDETEESLLMPFWEKTDWNEYINSGVLLLDLERIRNEHDLWEESIDFLDKYGFAYPDQDVINYLFRGKKYILPARFNSFSKNFPSVEKGVFYHYTYMAGEKDRLDDIDRLYLSYYERSPFYKNELDKKEKTRFLKRLKDHTEPYLRLSEMTKLNYEEISKLGWGLYLRGEYDRAIDILSKYTYQDTKDKNGLEHKEYIRNLFITGLIAKSLHKLDRTREAVERLEKAFARTAGEAPSYIGRDICEMHQSDLLGDLYYALGRYEDAEKAYLGAVYFETPDKRRQATASLEHLIRCALKAGNIRSAEKYYHMLQSVSLDTGRSKIFGLQIEIARNKEKDHYKE